MSATKVDPRKIGRYDVERLIGQGGMGRVWLARDTVLGRRVAIKVLRDDLALPPTVRDELLVRMGHEARAAAAVSHPNIVTLFDMGEDATLGLYLVFEYVTARAEDLYDDDVDAPLSLRDRLKRGPLSFADVAKLAREVGSALSFAHEAGVIHRDVKPENILFSRTGFKIADFGIARIPDSTITRANAVLGTPAYTAPEALSSGDFGPASDQFSLATTLYEAATGGRAFGGDDAIATAGKVTSEPPPPLHESIGPEAIVTGLDAALRRGMAKTAADRFPSCAALGDEVARAIEDPRDRRVLLASPVPILEIERTPLSSRVSLERTLGEHGIAASDSQRPSLFVRQRTHRFQNIATALALIVIIVLILMGRRSGPPPEPTPAVSASSLPPSSPSPTVSAPHAKPRPKASARPSPSEDASQPPPAADD